MHITELAILIMVVSLVAGIVSREVWPISIAAGIFVWLFICLTPTNYVVFCLPNFPWQKYRIMLLL